MMEDKDFLETLGDDLEQADSNYAAERPKERAVLELIRLRISSGLTQRQVADRMGVPPQRVTEIETRPWKATWERIHAYASALGADFTLTLPSDTGTARQDIDLSALRKKLRELSELLNPLSNAG